MVILALAAAGIGIGERLADRAPEQVDATPLDPADLRPGYGPRSFAEAIARADRKVAAWRVRVAQVPGDWLMLEGLAGSLAARYRLTGSFVDLAEADRLLDKSIAGAPWPSGPVLTRAGVSLSAHELGAADAALRRLDAWAVPPAAEERTEALSIECEIAFQRGRLERAAELCGSSDDLGLRMRRANIAAKRGDTAEAARIVEALLRTPRLPPSSTALLSLQRASIALARGDWPTARRWIEAADRVFPGWWLAEAYLAQQFALEGNLAEARRRFEALAARTGNPDVLDALAAVEQAQGDRAGAEARAAEAGTAWDERMRLLPTAAAAHHAMHVLAHGDAALALRLTHEEYRRRPTASAIAAYASALMANGRPEDAAALLAKGEAAGWRTAEMKLIEALALRVLGRADAAADAMRTATALNPRIADPEQRFVYFHQD